MDNEKDIGIGKILEETRKRNNFGGIAFTTNFATSYAPFSWVDSESDIRGAFRDVLEVIASKLNLTIVLKKSIKENLNVWFKK